MKYLKSYRTWLFLLYSLMVILLSMTPGKQFSLFLNLWKYDKIVHFVEYFGLGFLFVNMLMINVLDKRMKLYIVIFILLFPILDESLQYFTPMRIADFNDVIVDIIGGILGAYIRVYISD